MNYMLLNVPEKYYNQKPDENKIHISYWTLSICIC